MTVSTTAEVRFKIVAKEISDQFLSIAPYFLFGKMNGLPVVVVTHYNNGADVFLTFYVLFLI